MAISFKDFGNKLRNTEERSRVVLVEDTIKPTPEREKFFSSDVFSIGRTVLAEDKPHEIIDKRSNYVVIINEQGESQRKFPIDLIPHKCQMQYATGTYKGVNVPTGFEAVIAESEIKDPVGAIKMFEQFRQKNFATIFESADKIGLDLESLFEAVKSDQLQAISIIAGAVGVKLLATDPQKQVDELIKKATSKAMNHEQKTIFSNMLQMLPKLGLKVTDPIKESINKFDANYKDNKSQLNSVIKKHTHTNIGSSLHSDDTSRHLRVKKLMGI